MDFDGNDDESIKLIPLLVEFSETPLVGALIGPTFTCIVGDQFARSKKGDRYFYDLGDQTHSFSPGMLAKDELEFQ